jgi:hypothetical protein
MTTRHERHSSYISNCSIHLLIDSPSYVNPPIHPNANLSTNMAWDFRRRKLKFWAVKRSNYKVLLRAERPPSDRVTIKHRQNSYRITVINIVVNRADSAFLRKFVKSKFVKCKIVKKYSIDPYLIIADTIHCNDYIIHFSARSAQAV